MILLVDTNALVAATPGNLAPFEDLLAYARHTGAMVAVPEVVEAEYKAYLEREFAEVEAQIRRVTRRLPPDVAATVLSGEYRAAANLAKTQLVERLARAIEVKQAARIPMRAAHARRAVARAASRTPPCSPNGEQVRDALIWESALAVTTKARGPLVLISADAAFKHDLLGAETRARGTDLLLYPSIQSFLSAVTLVDDASGHAALTATIAHDRILSRLVAYAQEDPAGDWASMVDNFIESVMDFIGGNFSLQEFRDVSIETSFVVPTAKDSSYVHVVFYALGSAACQAFGWEERPPSALSDEDTASVDPAFAALLQRIPRRVPVGEAQMIQMDFDVEGHAIYRQTGSLIEAEPIAVYGIPVTAGPAGQPRLSRRIDVHEFLADLRRKPRRRRPSRRKS